MDDLSWLNDYDRLQFQVIPLINGEKGTWIEQWSSKPFPHAELLEQIQKNPPPHVGVVCGKLSKGLMALDVDYPDIAGYDPNPGIEKGALAHTTRKASRLVFYGNKDVSNFSRYVQHPTIPKKRVVEVLGQGRLFMAPPSFHPDTGEQLTWITPLEDITKANILTLYSLEELQKFLLAVLSESVVSQLFDKSGAQHSKTEIPIGLPLKTINQIRPNRILQKLGIKTKGKRYHCPFHKDTIPSGSIFFNADKEKWCLKCHVCHDDKEAWDMIGFVKELKELDSMERAFQETLKLSGYRHHNTPPKNWFYIISNHPQLQKRLSKNRLTLLHYCTTFESTFSLPIKQVSKELKITKKNTIWNIRSLLALRLLEKVEAATPRSPALYRLNKNLEEIPPLIASLPSNISNLTETNLQNILKSYPDQSTTPNIKLASAPEISPTVNFSTVSKNNLCQYDSLKDDFPDRERGGIPKKESWSLVPERGVVLNYKLIEFLKGTNLQGRSYLLGPTYKGRYRVRTSDVPKSLVEPLAEIGKDVGGFIEITSCELEGGGS